MGWRNPVRVGRVVLAVGLAHWLIGMSGSLQASQAEEKRRGLEELIARLTGELRAAQGELEALAGDPSLRSTRELPVEDPAFFQQVVGPILESRCHRCHGPLKQRGGLRLDSRQAMLLGGDHGTALVSGDTEASRLIQAVRREGDLEMPPSDPLEPGEVRALEAWVAAGAQWPATQPVSGAPGKVAARDVPRVAAALGPGSRVSFNRDVRPILSKHCFECHGPDERVRQAGLRLDDRESAFSVLPSGHQALVPNDLEQSQLFQRVAAERSEDRMPPSHHPKPLEGEQIELLGRFILQGAEWEPHWSFVPPRRAPTPELRDAAWPHNEIDRFVLARLEREGISPSPEADGRTLARRLALDLTGLPPSPSQVEELAGDERPDAVERYVDALLDSPRYGEHMARYWLDAARYADTNGYHIDNERFMWRWREWVMDAFNRNMPFDEFTVAQLAGDQLLDAGFEQQLATGFHRNHMINFEGGAVPEEYRTQYVFDRVDTTGTVWLGLTVGCAKCHDHKFDPISQREYYRLAAFFNSIEEQGLDGRTGNAQPSMPAPSPEQRAREEAVLHALEPLYALLDEPGAEVDAAELEWRTGRRAALAQKWRSLDALELRSTGGASFEPLPDGSVLVNGESPDTDTIEISGTTSLSGITAVRLEALRDESLPRGGFGRSAENGSFVLTELEVETAKAGLPFSGEPIPFSYGFAEYQSAGVRRAIDGDETTGWSADYQGKQTKRTAVFVADQPFGAEGSSRVRVRLRFESVRPQEVIGRFRLSLTNDPTMATTNVGTWWWSGPYDAASFSADPGVVAAVDLEDGYPDGRRRWVEWVHDDGAPSLNPGTSWLYRELEAPSDRLATYRVGAEGFRLWLNDEPTGGCSPAASGEPDSRDRTARTGPGCREREVELSLQRGRNRLLVQVLIDPEETAAPARFVFARKEEAVGTMPFELEALLAASDAQVTEPEATRQRRHYRRNHWAPWQPREDRFVELEAELEAVRAEIPTAMVMAERSDPRPTFVLRRGQYDQKGEQVQAGTPAVLPPLDGEPSRLALARWLVRPDHPLTARVVVNRIWARFFGRGLVRTVEDFGAQGELPSHPELLDWLALELVDGGWDLKALQKLIVTSATYRQGSAMRAELQARDPENRLLARASRLRLDAEVIRDNALAVSGLLVEKLGGPGVNPYQPPGLWREIGYESKGRFSASVFVRGDGEDLYRRSLYTFWKRTVPPPNMLTFDAPNRETCVVQRGRSNTPLQALILLNDPQFVEAARAFAERVLREAGPSVAERLDRAFRLALARPPTQAEVETLAGLVREQQDHYAVSQGAASDLVSVGEKATEGRAPVAEVAAWTVVASVILNLDEAITRT